VDLGIVIVSYNTRELTRNCLDSVFSALREEHLSARVCVIDNASSDGSPEMIRDAFPHAELTASRDNLGFARGTNLGLKSLQSSTDTPQHYLLLNPDTLVRRGALTEMKACLYGNPSVGAVGAQLFYGDGSFQHGAFYLPTLAMTLFDFWTINHRLINSRLNGRYPARLYAAGEPFPIGHPLGAALMMRGQALSSVGPLDEDYFMYCEEIDWCIRARESGWKIYCAPRAEIVHFAGQSTAQFRDEMFVALWRSRFRLFGKHYSRTYNAAVRALVRAGLARRARQVRRDLAEHRLSAEEAERQLAAFRQVLEM